MNNLQAQSCAVHSLKLHALHKRGHYRPMVVSVKSMPPPGGWQVRLKVQIGMLQQLVPLLIVRLFLLDRRGPLDDSTMRHDSEQLSATRSSASE